MEMKECFGKRIVRVVEENVDGCGGDAEIFVECTEPLTAALAEQLSVQLRQAKIDHANDDYDTEDLVEAAVEKFNDKNGLLGCGFVRPQMRVIGSPFAQTITF